MVDVIEQVYGNWIIVISLILLALFFITRYLPFKSRSEKKTSGILTTFFIAMFAEMYGFPLTIYLLSSFFGMEIPLTHAAGHLFAYFLTYLGIGIGYAWFIIMLISTVLIITGAKLVIDGWKQVYHSKGKLITAGIYKKMRHPQYSGILLIVIGFLIQWPTLITLLMWPFLFLMYYRLAKREEKDLEKKFKTRYLSYKKDVPMFIPKFKIGLWDVKQT